MFTKKRIIDGMCMTFRHDFGLLPTDRQRSIRGQMEQLFEHNFLPVLEDIHDDADCGCKHCMVVVVDTARKAMGRERRTKWK